MQRLSVRPRATVGAVHLIGLEYRWMRGIRRRQRVRCCMYVFTYDLFLSWRGLRHFSWGSFLYKSRFPLRIPLYSSAAQGKSLIPT